MKRSRQSILLLTISASLAFDQQQRLRGRSLQGFGVGVGLGTAAPAPFVPEAENLSTSSPTPLPTPLDDSTIAPTTTPTAAPSVSPSSTQGTTIIEPTALPTIAIELTPPPTPVSTGGTITVVQGLDPAENLSDPLNFYVEFQIHTEDLAAAVEDVKASLNAYLATMELSLDADSTEGPVHAVELDVAGKGPCPNLPPNQMCERIHVAISCNVNEASEYSDLIISQRIRGEFVDSFNSVSNTTRLLFEYPLLVVGRMIFSMTGSMQDMDDTERGYFAAFAERRVIEPIFEEQASKEYSLLSVGWEDVFPVDAGDYSEFGETPIEDAEHRMAELSVLASCRSDVACTSKDFQHYIEKKAEPSIDSLFSALRVAGEEVPYFSQIESLQLLRLSQDANVLNEVDQNRPPVLAENKGSRTPGVATKQQIPLWVWMLVVADFAVLVGIFAYVSHRRSKRKVQGDKMKDSPEEKQNRMRNLQVTPFHQRPKPEEPVVKTAAQIEEEEYDARSYDFSVEAGDLSDDDSEVDLSSFRRPRTKRF